jgi:hypothetical protein
MFGLRGSLHAVLTTVGSRAPEISGYCIARMTFEREDDLCSGFVGPRMAIENERIFLELMTSDHKLQASREGSK